MDRDELHRLYVDHVDVVFRYAASRCGRDHAHDVAAETFAEALRGGYDPARGSERAWLLGIATNRIRRRRREEETHLAADHGVHDEQLLDLPDRLDAAALGAALRGELLRLPASERSAFLLHAIGELTPAEVAAALDIAPTAARVRLHRARTRLRAALEIPATEELTR